MKLLQKYSKTWQGFLIYVRERVLIFSSFKLELNWWNKKYLNKDEPNMNFYSNKKNLDHKRYSHYLEYQICHYVVNWWFSIYLLNQKISIWDNFFFHVPEIAVSFYELPWSYFNLMTNLNSCFFEDDKI